MNTATAYELIEPQQAQPGVARETILTAEALGFVAELATLDRQLHQ